MIRGTHDWIYSEARKVGCCSSWTSQVVNEDVSFEIVGYPTTTFVEC